MSDLEKQITDFWAKVDKTPSCWGWTGYLHRGYGRAWFRGRTTGAHRIAYELERGPIPAGQTIDHLCRNRACVRPDHLEVVTNKENVLRGFGWTAVNARKTHCNNGHLLDDANTYRQAGRPNRLCRTCRRSARTEYARTDAGKAKALECQRIRRARRRLVA